MSVWMSKLIEKYSEINEKKKLDPVGQADADIDNDGDVDSTDKYLHNRRKAIKKSMQKEAEDKTTPCPNCEGSMENHSPDCKSNKESKAKDDTAVVNPKQEKNEKSVSEGSYGANVIKAAKMYMKDSSCSYEMAAEKYGCSAEQVKKCCAEMQKNEDVQEIARSMTPMKNKFGKSKAEKEAEAKKMKKENKEWPIYQRIMEKRDEHYKSATQTQAMDDNMAGDAKEFVDAHTKGDNKEADKVDINVAIEKNLTGMANPVKTQAKLRPGDNNQGDKVADKPEGKM